MSYEIANDKKLLGQFASGKGYADFIRAVTSDYPALKSLVVHGASEDVPAVEKDLAGLIKDASDDDVKSTAMALKSLIDKQSMIVVTNGMLPDESDD